MLTNYTHLAQESHRSLQDKKRLAVAFSGFYARAQQTARPLFPAAVYASLAT
jgi:broad specificity phosphatase PhoE